MSYRKWMKKWQPVIFWAVAAAFVVGIGWWSAAFYVRMKSTKRAAKPDLEYLARYATAYLVRGATDTEISSLSFLPGMGQILVLEDVGYGVGTVEPTKMWIDTDEFQSVYPSVKAYYEAAYLGRTLDPVFEDFLLRAQTIAYSAFIKILQDYQSVEPMPTSTPSTDEVYEYFDKSATSLAPLYSEYHVKLLTLDSTQMKVFSEYLLTLGFDEAATKVGQEPFDLGSMKGEQLLSLGIDERIVREMYESGKGSVIGPQPFGSGWLFVSVLDATLVKSASDLSSEDIEKIRNQIRVERIQDYMRRVKEHYEERGEAIVINDDNLRLWYEYYRYTPKGKLSQLVRLGEEIKKYVIKENGEVNVESLSTLQALYVLILEREKMYLQDMENLLTQNSTSSDLNLYEEAFGKLSKDEIEKKINETDDLRKKIVSNLYYEGYKVYGVLSRMVELFGDLKYRLELAKVSYESKKEVARRLQVMYGVKPNQLMNSFMPELQSFLGVAHSDEVSTPMKLEALEGAYDLLKFLGVYEAASSVLSDIKESSPSYKGWNFDEMFKELEELMSATQTEATPSFESSPLESSTPSTEASE